MWLEGSENEKREKERRHEFGDVSRQWRLWILLGWETVNGFSQGSDLIWFVYPKELSVSFAIMKTTCSQNAGFRCVMMNTILQNQLISLMTNRNESLCFLIETCAAIGVACCTNRI